MQTRRLPLLGILQTWTEKRPKYLDYIGFESNVYRENKTIWGFSSGYIKLLHFSGRNSEPEPQTQLDHSATHRMVEDGFT